MADSKWIQISVEVPFQDELNQALDIVQQVLDKITQILNVLKQILEIAKLIAAAAAADPLETIINQLLDQIDKLLENILENMRLHAIFVPIRKQPYGLGIEFPDILVQQNPPTAAQLNEAGAFNGTSTTYSDVDANSTSNFINTSHYAVGGNRGFYAALRESIADEGDINRPNFDSTFTVTGGCILVGTQTFTLLMKIMQLLNALLKLGERTDLLRNTFKPPQGLRARVIPLTTVGAQEGRIGVVLDWQKPQLRINFPFYNEEEALVDEIIVIRSTDYTLRGRFNWSEIFPDANLSNDRSILPESSTGRTKVIKRIKNDGFSGRYVDSDPELKENKNYYYTLAFRYKLNGEYLPITGFSNVVKVRFVRPLESLSSEPPDWIATKSLAELFPILEEIIGLIRLLLAELRTKSFSGPTILDNLIEIIEALIKKGETANAYLQEILDLIRALVNTDVAGLYATQITTPGGMTAWLSELAIRLGNPNDPSRPPFDDPKDLVMGVVVVAGIPRMGSIDTTSPFSSNIAAVEKLLALLFGGGGNDDNPILKAIDAIDNAVPTDDSATQFGDDMKPKQVSPTTTPTTPSVVFNEQMQPSKTIC